MGQRRLLERGDGIVWEIGPSSDGTFVINWPTLPNLDVGETDQVPALVTMDAAWIQSTEEHLRQILADRRPLTHLKAVVLSSTDVTEREKGHQLSMFFELGKDSEAALLMADLDAKTKARAGFAVSLVLVHGILAQPNRPLGRRLLLPYDDQRHRHELFSTHISVDDFQELDQPQRSSLDPEAAILKLEQDRVGKADDEPPGVVGLDIFRRAARRGFLDEFGVSIELDQLEDVKLPEALWIIPQGEDQLPVVPRLFTLDLSLRASVSGVHPEEMQKRLQSSRNLKLAFQRDPQVRAMGMVDMQSPNEELNHFLSQALGYDHGEWLQELLKRLGIAEL